MQYFSYFCSVCHFYSKEIINYSKEIIYSLNYPFPYRDFNIRLFALSIAMLSNEAR